MKTEISVFIHQDIIDNLKILDSIEFLLPVLRAISVKFYMPGDYIVRLYEYADYFYVMKYGYAEILATDWETRINAITTGEYFGEIGILIRGTRSATVKAQTVCLTAAICKKDFLKILKSYP